MKNFKTTILVYFVQVILIILTLFGITSLIWLVTLFGFNLQEAMLYNVNNVLPYILIFHFGLTFFGESEEE